MSEPGGLRGDTQRQHPAEASFAGDRGFSRHVHCRLAPGSGPGFTDEMSYLLRTRLRLAILIILGGFALHFLRNVLLGSVFDHRPLRLLFAGCEMAVLAVASALLWSRRRLSMKSLRVLELALFAMVAAFFAWLQVDTYHDGALLRALVPGHEAIVFGLAGMSAALRWFLLIVLYGAFIPNTWRRCALVVGSLAALPVVLTVAGSQLDRTTGPLVLSALPETVILMATAVAIAVFGSHRIRELHKEAHE